MCCQEWLLILANWLHGCLEMKARFSVIQSQTHFCPKWTQIKCTRMYLATAATKETTTAVAQFPNNTTTLWPPKQKQLVGSIRHALCEAGHTCFSFSVFLPLSGSVQGCVVFAIVFYGSMVALSPLICSHIHQEAGTLEKEHRLTWI